MKAAQLAAKNAALQEELQTYQTYMRTTVVQYKKQIQSLKLQLNTATAMAAAGASERRGSIRRDSKVLAIGASEGGTGAGDGVGGSFDDGSVSAGHRGSVKLPIMPT